MSTADNQTESPHLTDYWQMIRSRWPLILLIFSLALGSGYFTSVYLLTKIYGATSQIKILRDASEIDVFKHTDSAFFDPVFFESEIGMIKSKTILIPVINELKLQESWSQRYSQGKSEVPLDYAYQLLKNHFIKVEPLRGSNILEIEGLSEKPQEAADIANKIAEVYIRYRQQDAAKNTNSGLQKLNDEIASRQALLDEAKRKVEDLRKSLNIDETSFSQNFTQGVTDLELQNKSHMLDVQRADYEGRKTRYEELKAVPPDELVDTLSALNLSDENLTNVHQQQLQLQASLAENLKSGLAANHPKILSLQSELEKRTEQIKSLAAGKLNGVKIDVDIAKTQLDEIASEVEALKTAAREEKSDKFAPFHEAQEEAKRQQDLLDTLKIRAVQEAMDRKEQGDLAIKISDAVPKDRPEKPVLWQDLLISGVLGLFLAISLVLFIEYIDTSIKSVAEAERILKLPVLTVVPTGVESLLKLGSDSPQAECYRILRAKLNLRPGGPKRILTSVSSGPGEGKSTTMHNLAYICSQAGEPVLIVDADLRRPTQHRLLNLPLENGVSDCLSQKRSAHEFVKSSSVPNLYLLSAGEITTESKGLFHEDTLYSMLMDLQRTYPIILIDSPPALGIGDASVIARVSPETLLVVQHRRYPRNVALRAKKTVDEVGGNVVGIVLNAIALNTEEGYYHYSAYSSYYHRKRRQRTADSPTPKRTEAPTKASKLNGKNGSHSSDNF